VLRILYAFANGIIKAVGIALGSVLSLLPSSPFEFSLNVSSEWIKAICWLIPVPVMVAHLEVFLLAVASYYAVRIVLRWMKAVGS
jgi:hypothetical protein